MSSPIPFPETWDHLLVVILSGINRSLKEWGFVESPRFAFAEQIANEITAARANATALEAWVQAREKWLAEGDRILEAMEEALCTDVLAFDHGSRHLRGRIYRLLCSAVVRVQYMLVIVEVQLDILSYDPNPWSRHIGIPPRHMHYFEPKRPCASIAPRLARCDPTSSGEPLPRLPALTLRLDALWSPCFLMLISAATASRRVASTFSIGGGRRNV